MCAIRAEGSVARRQDLSKSVTTSNVTIAPGVREVVSEDGAVLLDIEQGVCFSLNSVGLRIWELLKMPCTLDQIADTLAREFSVPRSQVLSDAAEFIEALEAKHLIQPLGVAARNRRWLARMLPRRKKIGSPSGS